MSVWPGGSSRDSTASATHRSPYQDWTLEKAPGFYIRESISPHPVEIKEGDRRIKKLAAKIKPLSWLSEGRPGWVQNYKTFGTSFNFVEADKLAPVDEPLEVIASIHTHHTFAAPSIFKATPAEVLAQIPPDMLDGVVGYSIDPEYEIQVLTDLDSSDPLRRSSWHQARVWLYRKAKKPEQRAYATPPEILYG